MARLPHCALFDVFHGIGNVDDTLDIKNARRDDVIGIDLARLDQISSTLVMVILPAVAIGGLRLRAVLR